MTDARRSRTWLVAFVVTLPAVAAAVACTAGDPLLYSTGSAVSSEAGADGSNDAGVPADGSLITVPNLNDGGFLPALRAVVCSSLDPDGGCDPTAGLGCCLASTTTMAVNDNTCFDQAQHFGGAECKDAGDVFLACLSSTGDSVCCWQPEGPDRMNTRYRSECDGGIEACDPVADGGSCQTGGPCKPTLCKGVTVGYCGTGVPPCKE